MHRRQKAFLHSVAERLDIPQDIILDLPRLTMLGNKQLLIENHKGIIEYTASLVRIKLSQGVIFVHGDSLLLGNLQAEQILVEGSIREIKYDA